MALRSTKRKKSKDPASGKALKIKKLTKEAAAIVQQSDEDESMSDDYDGASEEEEQRNDAQAANGEGKELSAASPKLHKSDLYKPPTSEELAQLKETEMLFKSSLFSMQINELLGEIMIGEKRKRTIDAYLHSVKEFLSSLKSGKEHELSDITWLSKGVCLPFVPHPTPSKGKFKFGAPADIKVIGSYLLGTCIKPDVHVDLAVTLPKECLQAKDYLNQRYLLKRAVYLTVIAQKLKKSNLVGKVSFCYSKGNHTRPVVIIQPSESHGKGFTIRIHAHVDSGVFKLNRFHIKKNNIRTSWFYPDQEETMSGGGDEEETEEPPTPHYNTWNLIDLTLPAHLQHTHSTIQGSDGVRDGIALLKVWLHQRELDVGQGCFSGFIMTMYVTYLMAKKKLNSLMSSYQIMRNTLLYLGQENWTVEGISLVQETQSDPSRPSMEDFQSAFEVVFVDPSGYVNLCADMTSSMFNMVKHEADLSVQCLETPGIDSFEALFMTPVSFFLKFDMSFHLSSLENLQAVTEKFGMKQAMMDQCGDYIAASVPTLMSLLSRSIGKRTKLIYVKMPNPQQWAINEEPRGFADFDKISFGLLLDLENAGSVVDKGPLADSPEAKEFQALWGEASELRRFQDASIREAVVWPAKTNSERRTIIGKIVKHILNRHADIPRDTITIVGNQIDPLLKIPLIANKNQTPYGTGEERHLNIQQTFDELSKQIRGLPDLPLTITSIQGTSAVFRYSEVFPPMPAVFKRDVKRIGSRLVPGADLPCPTYTSTIKVLCLLESSGKWPDDLEAIRRVKAAFHIQLGRSLHNQHGLTTSPHANHVDVFKKGYVFRLEIGYAREMTLLKMVSTPEGTTKMVDTAESQTLEKALVVLPKLTSTVHGIQQQNGSFCSAVRLAKRWLASHMLLVDHVPEVAVDLIMSHVYTTTAPFSAPRSPLVGFSRFLSLLCTHDWSIFPLIVNLNTELKSEDYTEIRNRFTKNRKSLPLMFLATPFDKYDSVWTNDAPSAPILRRVVLLAQESQSVLNGLFQDTRINLDFRQIFRPPLDAYDAIIHLNPKQVPRCYQAVDLSKEAVIPKFKVYEQTAERDRMPVSDYNPVERFLAELRAVYGEVALFLHDHCGGDIIAVLWKPTALQSQKFKVNEIHARRPESSESEGDIQMALDIPAIVEDFTQMGEGLVTSIDLKNKS